MIKSVLLYLLKFDVEIFCYVLCIDIIWEIHYYEIKIKRELYRVSEFYAAVQM